MSYIMTPQAAPKRTSKGSSGGSKMGSLLGAAVGLGAAVATGGMTLPATVGLMSAGASLGGVAGGAIDPARAETYSQAPSAPQVQQPSGAAERRLQDLQSTPMFSLHEANRALKTQPLDVQKEYQPILDEAIKRAGGSTPGSGV